MKSKRLRLRLGGMGTLLLVPRALCVAASSSRLTDDDARVALEPLNRIHLGKVVRGRSRSGALSGAAVRLDGGQRTGQLIARFSF